MLTVLIVNIINFAFDCIAGWIPNGFEMDLAFDGLPSALDSVFTFLHNVNYFLPLDTCVVILGIEVGIQVVMFFTYFTDKARRVVTSFIP